VLHFGIALYADQPRTLKKIDQIYLESLEMWCWRRMEIFLNDRVKNDEVLDGVKEIRNVLSTIKRRRANWIGHILRRNCFLKHFVEG